MCVFEAVSRRLNLQSPSVRSMGRGDGGPTLTVGDVAAMLAGLPRPVQALALAKLTGDRREMTYLKASLMLEVGDLARLQGWTIGKGQGRLEPLAELVRDDLVLSRVRSGDDAVNQVERRYWPDSRRIEFLGINKTAWIRVWRFRYGDLLRIGQDWEHQAKVKLGREFWAIP